jgi:hypothetical protein
LYCSADLKERQQFVYNTGFEKLTAPLR